MDQLAEWQDEWELVLTHERKVAALSRVTYVRAVRQLREFLAEAYPDVTTPAKITSRHVGAYLSGMADAGRSENTRRIRLKSLRLWFKYLITQEDSGVTRNPAAEVDLPEEKLPPVPVIADEDLMVLLRSMAGNSLIDRRDTAIVRLLLDTGVRRGELVGIDVDDVDLRHQGSRSAGRRAERRASCRSVAGPALALRKYLRARERHAASGSAALFLAVRSDQTGTWRLTGGGVGEMLTRRCEAAKNGAPPRAPVPPHLGR